MLARGSRDTFLQTRARWEAAGDTPKQVGREDTGTRTLPSRGRRTRLRRSDSRDSLDDGRPSHDSPPSTPTPGRDSASKSKSKSDKRRKSSATGEERTSVVPLLPFSDGTEVTERKISTPGPGDERRESVVQLLPFSDGIELADAPARPESPRRSSKSRRKSSAVAVTLIEIPDEHITSNKPREERDTPDKPRVVQVLDGRDTPDRPIVEPDRRTEDSAKRRLGRTPSLGARDRPSLWSTEREDPKSPPPPPDGDPGGGGGGGGDEYRPSPRAALGIGSDWGGSLNRRRMPRTETPTGAAIKASGFQLPAVISGRLSRQSEGFVSSSPDLSRELFSPPAEGRSPRTGRRDLDEILERAAKRRHSRQAAGGAPLLTARALFAVEPRAGRTGRAESEDRAESPDSPGGRSWMRVRRDSDTSDASSAAGRSGGLDGERMSERPPASPLVAGSGLAPRRAGFRGRAGSEGGLLDAPDAESSPAVGTGGWRGASRSWLSLGASRSAEAAAEDAAETSSVSSSSTDRKSSTRTWLAQGRLDADDASETASVSSGGGGGSRRKGISRDSGWTESAEETSAASDRLPATPPPKERRASGPAASLTSLKSYTPVTRETSESFNGSVAEDDEKTADVFSTPADRSTLLRRKLAALRAGGQSEEADRTPREEPESTSRASQLRAKVAALTPETADSQPRDTDVPKDDTEENRATLLRKRIAAMKQTKPETEREESTAEDGAAPEESRAAALRQKITGLTLPVGAETDVRSAELGPLRSPLTPRTPRPAERLSEAEPGSTPAEETGRSRATGRSKIAQPVKPTASPATPAGVDSGRPPTDPSPASARGPRPRSAVRRTSSLSGARDSSVGRSRSRSPVKGRIATLRLKPRRVSQSPDPLARWRSYDDVLGTPVGRMDDVLSSPAGPVDASSDDVSWEPQTAAVEPTSSSPTLPSLPGIDDPPKSTAPPLPPARPPRRRRSRPGESAPPAKERVDENRNQICSTESESREEESSSAPSSPTPGRPTEKDAEAWLASLVPAGRSRTSSTSSVGSLGSFDFEKEFLSAEEQAPGLPRQLTSVKSDLIAFSPKKLDETVSTPPATAAAPAADLSSASAPSAGAPALAADLSTATPPPSDSNVAQLLKKQELYFQDQLLKRDREMTAMKNANSKLIQQASSNKTEKSLEQATRLVALLTNENSKLRRELKTALPKLAAERDEARQEVANAEAMFADLHRKYEKSKAVLQEYRRCADRNDAACGESRERADREKQRYDMLKQHAEDAHERLQADYESAEKAHQAELLTLKAKLQLAENREAKLERENREITAICDELIQKMGSAGR